MNKKVSLIRLPLGADEAGGVAVGVEAVADDAHLVVLSLYDAFAEVLDEVEVFAPGGEDVFLADAAAHAV